MPKKKKKKKGKRAGGKRRKPKQTGKDEGVVGNQPSSAASTSVLAKSTKKIKRDNVVEFSGRRGRCTDFNFMNSKWTVVLWPTKTEIIAELKVEEHKLKLADVENQKRLL